MRALLVFALLALPAMAQDNKPDVTAWKQSLETPPVTIWERTLDSRSLLGRSSPYSLGIRVQDDGNGNPVTSSYHQLNLIPQKGLSLSFEKQRPKINVRSGSVNTAIKLRGDGVKLQFNPVDKTIPLQVELKVTNDESSLNFGYRF